MLQAVSPWRARYKTGRLSFIGYVCKETPWLWFHKTSVCQLDPCQRWSRSQKQVNVNVVPASQCSVGKSTNHRFNRLSLAVFDVSLLAQSFVDQTMVASAGRMIRKIFP